MSMLSTLVCNVYSLPYNQQPLPFPLLFYPPPLSPLMPWLAVPVGECSLRSIRGLIGTVWCSLKDSWSFKPWRGLVCLVLAGTPQSTCRDRVAISHWTGPGHQLVSPLWSSSCHPGARWGLLALYALVSICCMVLPKGCDPVFGGGGRVGECPTSWGSQICCNP